MSMTSSVEDAESVPDIVTEETSLSVKDLSLFYGQKQALANINMEIATRKVTAFIGPSGCGKSTLLRCFNRMNDLIDIARVDGTVRYHGVDLYDESDNSDDDAQLAFNIGEKKFKIDNKNDKEDYHCSHHFNDK